MGVRRVIKSSFRAIQKAAAKENGPKQSKDVLIRFLDKNMLRLEATDGYMAARIEHRGDVDDFPDFDPSSSGERAAVDARELSYALKTLDDKPFSSGALWISGDSVSIGSHYGPVVTIKQTAEPFFGKLLDQLMETKPKQSLLVNAKLLQRAIDIVLKVIGDEAVIELEPGNGSEPIRLTAESGATKVVALVMPNRRPSNATR